MGHTIYVYTWGALVPVCIYDGTVVFTRIHKGPPCVQQILIQLELDVSIIKENGKLTGILVDAPMRLISNILPKPSIIEKVKALKDAEKISFENALTKIKPPIFWKEKPNVIAQLKKWKEGNINLLLKNLYELEIKIKSNSSLNKKNLVKKFIVDICNLANAS